MGSSHNQCKKAKIDLTKDIIYGTTLVPRTYGCA